MHAHVALRVKGPESPPAGTSPWTLMQGARCTIPLLSQRQTRPSTLLSSGSMVRTTAALFTWASHGHPTDIAACATVVRAGPYASKGLQNVVQLEVPAERLVVANCNAGGPGCSSIGGGFLSELGPFYPTKGEGLVNTTDSMQSHILPAYQIGWITFAQNVSILHSCGFAIE